MILNRLHIYEYISTITIKLFPKAIKRKQNKRARMRSTSTFSLPSIMNSQMAPLTLDNSARVKLLIK